ncbi:hypothetical protein POSPLADRAFT_1127795 [Postia placenta MAD-698-R-SB12]|uniref:AMP-dependent synthetase/ligase domain-containing protein n=1 Tax=Postia placenta MAD-698-R-SB12 TaxID=670580 RepID=A0A1X6NFJ9_9APHY|nr:hypothetical protein POSPLADRAFT_1127795 [Postia placenta MAD-698-R-SB12]OSX67394.1 hypothetical protein POSPLADRAFT_1127795 [Postia placenta MAD-698-R-SB12]
MTLKTHLTVLYWSASTYSSAPAFYIPDVVGPDERLRKWNTVTYQQFLSDVEQSARMWSSKLRKCFIAPRSVVGLWLGGMTYADVLHIYGVARAGYIPQLFSLRLPNPDVVYELLHRAGGQAMIYDSSFASVVRDCPVPAIVTVDLGAAAVDNVPLPPIPEPLSEEDTAMIFHTSGSTSGSPKLVHCSYKWLDAIVAKGDLISRPFHEDRKDVIVWMGSMCHIGQTVTLVGALQHGTCVIQPTTLAFSSDELIRMISDCGLNRLTQFATSVAKHLRNSHENPRLLALLQGLDEVLYAGLPLPVEEEKWGRQNGILLRNLFGNTECGPMLISVGGRGQDASLLQPLEGTKYAFLPITAGSGHQENTHHNANSQLLELVILAESPDCPDPSLRQTDGHLHTGDLFVEAAPRRYVSRGRDDDWIKSENSLRCDTKAIEENVRATCADLVAECVVVGNGRPSPALFVEPKGDIDGDKLRKDIIRRTRHFHSRRYLHERIVSSDYIIVVARNTLPRTATKGNIRRRAVEDAFKTELDRVYKVSSKA